MTGIAGIISPRPAEECQHLVSEMVTEMEYEAFYVSGTCFVPKNGVYAAWVAHENSFAARQSAYTNPNDVTLLFSGEAFQPHQPPEAITHLDSPCIDAKADLLLNLYHQFGDSFVARINGIFSGLLVDRKKKRVLLFNDRYGIERIYFYQKDHTCFFASEVKSLLRIIPEVRAFDDEGVAEFCAFGCTLGRKTVFRNIQILPGGSSWIFEARNQCRKQRYFLPETWESQPPLTEKAFEDEFIATFSRVLPRYFSSDTPIGISLTGGLDTRLIMAGIPQGIPRPVCYTFGGSEGETADTKLASRIAKTCGFEHHILRIGSDFLPNFGQYLDRTVFISDGCAGAMTAHEIYLNSKSRELSRVRLTGNFGSEILRRMSTFKPLNLAQPLFERDFYQIVKAFSDGFSCNNQNPVTFAAFQEIPWNIFGVPAVAKSQLTLRTPYLDNEIVGLAYRLPLSFQKPPGYILSFFQENNPELGRIPTDRGFVSVNRSPLNIIRRFFSAATFKLDHYNNEGLPGELAQLDPVFRCVPLHKLIVSHKYLHYRKWFQDELSAYITDVLTDPSIKQLPYWNPKFLSTIIEHHRTRKRNFTRELHTLLTLEAVERLLIRRMF
ncbi:MAG: asparagine synthase-related protein [Gammaproteobacteria bacterium]